MGSPRAWRCSSSTPSPRPRSPSFIGGYVEALGLFGLTNGWVVYLIAYAIFIGIHLYGVGEALKLMFAITAVAVVALLATVIGLLPRLLTSTTCSTSRSDSGAAMSSDFLPFGIAGVVAALVYGIWFFLAIEGVPLAAEEADDPAKDMPRGIIGGMLTLLLFAALILFIVPGAAGSSTVAGSDNPLPEAIRAVRGDGSALADFVNYAGLAGLIASFFSIIYAYSRQLFALSRAGYLPRHLSLTTGRNTPWAALIAPGTIGFALAAVLANTMDTPADAGALLINIAVFGATVSYVLLNLSHILLRRSEPDLERPYRTPGGVFTTGVALVLSVVAVIATFFVDTKAAGITAGVFVAALAYFWFYSRHHLVHSAPEEEFAAIEEAESHLH